MPDSKSLGPTIAAASLLLGGIGLYVNILHYRVADKTDYMPVVEQIAFFAVVIILTVWAVYRNLKDANRAKSLQAQIVSLKEEFRLQEESNKNLHADYLRRLDISHKAELWRANEGRQQCESERRDALARVDDLEARLALISPSSKLVIHSAYYGNSPEREESVIERVRDLPVDALAISVTNNVLGCDPAPNIPPKKQLRVTYSYGSDTVFETSRDEGEWLVLPDPTDRKRIIK